MFDAHKIQFRSHKPRFLSAKKYISFSSSCNWKHIDFADIYLCKKDPAYTYIRMNEFMLRCKRIYKQLCTFSIVLYSELVKYTAKISTSEKQFRPPFTAFLRVSVQDSLWNVSFCQYSHESYLCKSVVSKKKLTLCYSVGSQKPAPCHSVGAKEPVLLNSVVVHKSMTCATQSVQKSLYNTRFKWNFQPYRKHNRTEIDVKHLKRKL